LELAITTHMTPAQLTESIAIDNIYKSCMDKAEQHCRHLKMGEVQFSDITLLPRNQVQLTSGSSPSCVDKVNTSDPGSGNVQSPKPSLLNQPRTSNFLTCSSDLKHHT
jgi:hypothetical protein